MATPAEQNSFPLMRALLLLSAAAGGLYIVLRLALGLVYGELEGVGAAVDVAALVVWCSAVLGLMPVVLLARAGLMAIVYGYFIGTVVRVLIVLLATVAVLVKTPLPAVVWVVTLFGMYLPLLFLEVSLVGRFIWSKHLPGHASPQSRPPRDDARRDDTISRRMEALA